MPATRGSCGRPARLGGQAAEDKRSNMLTQTRLSVNILETDVCGKAVPSDADCALRITYTVSRPRMRGVDGARLTRLRAVSEAFTAAPHRLEVAIAVGRLPEREFANKDVQAVVAEDVSQPVVSRNLKALAQAGFLHKIKDGLYSRNESALWEFCSSLEAELGANTLMNVP